MLKKPVRNGNNESASDILMLIDNMKLSTEQVERLLALNDSMRESLSQRFNIHRTIIDANVCHAFSGFRESERIILENKGSASFYSSLLSLGVSQSAVFAIRNIAYPEMETMNIAKIEQFLPPILRMLKLCSDPEQVSSIALELIAFLTPKGIEYTKEVLLSGRFDLSSDEVSRKVLEAISGLSDKDKEEMFSVQIPSLIIHSAEQHKSASKLQVSDLIYSELFKTSNSLFTVEELIARGIMPSEKVMGESIELLAEFITSYSENVGLSIAADLLNDYNRFYSETLKVSILRAAIASSEKAYSDLKMRVNRNVWNSLIVSLCREIGFAPGEIPEVLLQKVVRVYA